MIEIRSPQITEMPDVYALRWNVLRDPQVPGQLIDPYDDQLGVVHGAAFISGELASTGRIHRVPQEPEIMQVRYMATKSECRGAGIGAEVLGLMEEKARALCEPQAFIANARVAALGLYMRAGYRVVSDEFELVGVPHVKIRKELTV